MRIHQPTTYERRTEVARTCSAELNLKIPQLVDDMQNTVAQAFSAWPDRLFILSPQGKIAYRGGPGPRGFNVAEMESALQRLLPSAP